MAELSMEELIALEDGITSLTQEYVPDRAKIIKPPFGWPGGKSKALDKILPMLPRRRGYVEVFGGSGAILLSRPQSKLEVFNDRYAGVTDFYRCLRHRENKDRLIAWLKKTVHSREEWKLCHDTWESQDDIVERAGRWLYMTAYSFSSLGRCFGRSTTPDGSMSGKLARNAENLTEVHIRFSETLIENQDFRAIFRDFDHPDTVFYGDPPYLGVENTHYKHGMTVQCHRDLMVCCANCKGFVAISGYENELTKEIYDTQTFWTNKIKWEQRTTIAGFSENTNKGENSLLDSKSAMECLWIKEVS